MSRGALAIMREPHPRRQARECPRPARGTSFRDPAIPSIPHGSTPRRAPRSACGLESRQRRIGLPLGAHPAGTTAPRSSNQHESPSRGRPRARVLPRWPLSPLDRAFSPQKWPSAGDPCRFSATEGGLVRGGGHGRGTRVGAARRQARRRGRRSETGQEGRIAHEAAPRTVIPSHAPPRSHRPESRSDSRQHRASSDSATPAWHHPAAFLSPTSPRRPAEAPRYPT